MKIGIVFKSALATLAAIFIAAVVAVVILLFGFPSTVANLLEQTGNYKSAARFAAMQYNRTDDIDDLGRLVMDSILAEDDEYIQKYGGELIGKQGFDDYCVKQDEYYSKGDYSEYRLSFKQYVCGNVACAQYRGGDFDIALETAQSALDGVTGFPIGNAMVSLSLEVCRKHDGISAARILNVFNAFPEITDGTEKEYFELVKHQLKAV